MVRKAGWMDRQMVQSLELAMGKNVWRDNITQHSTARITLANAPYFIRDDRTLSYCILPPSRIIELNLTGNHGIKGPFCPQFNSSLSKFCESTFCSNSDYNHKSRSHFCTCHDSRAVVTCAKLWPDQLIKNKMHLLKDLDHQLLNCWWNRCWTHAWGFMDFISLEKWYYKWWSIRAFFILS